MPTSLSPIRDLPASVNRRTTALTKPHSQVIIVSEPSAEAARRASTGRSIPARSRSSATHNDTPRHADARPISVHTEEHNLSGINNLVPPAGLAPGGPHDRVRIRPGRGLRAITTEPLVPQNPSTITCRSSSSTVQCRCPDGNLTRNARTRFPRSRIDSHERLPATSTRPTKNHRTTDKIARFERRHATADQPLEKTCSSMAPPRAGNQVSTASRDPPQDLDWGDGADRVGELAVAGE